MTREVDFYIDMSRLNGAEIEKTDLSIQGLVARSTEMTAILQNKQEAVDYAAVITSYGNAAETYAKTVVYDLSPKSKLSAIRESAAIEAKKGPGRPSEDIQLLRDLSDYVVALCPEEWKKACNDNRIVHRLYQAEPSHMARLWTDRPLTSGILLRKASYQINRAEERARTLVQPIEGTVSALYPLSKRWNDVALLITYFRTMMLLADSKKVCTKSEEKVIMGLGKKIEKAMIENPVASHATIGMFNFSEDILNIARRIQQRGHGENISTLLANDIKSFEEIKQEITENWIILADVFEARGYSDTGPVKDAERGYSTEEIARDLEIRARYQEAEKERKTKDTNERLHFEELCRKLAQVEAEAQKLQQPWTLSSKSIKNRKLKPALHTLVQGICAADGTDILPGRSKAQAYELVSHIEYFRDLAQRTTPAGFYEHLDAIRAKENALLEAILEITDKAATLPSHLQNELISSTPDISKNSLSWAYIAGNWPVISQLIKTTWPEGNFVVGQLEEMLKRPEFAEVEEEEKVGPSPPIADQLASEEALDIADDSSILPREVLHDIAMQLDTVILPPESTISDLKTAVEKLKLPEEQTIRIDWNRLYNLVKVRDDYEGIMYRSKKGSLGNAPPYFVVEFEYEGCTYAVAESPVQGNATYVVAEKNAAGTWLEILSLPKNEARLLGAQRIIHRGPQAPERHREKIETKLIDLMSVAV
jgi:hypothetical protein